MQIHKNISIEALKNLYDKLQNGKLEIATGENEWFRTGYDLQEDEQLILIELLESEIKRMAEE